MCLLAPLTLDMCSLAYIHAKRHVLQQLPLFALRLSKEGLMARLPLGEPLPHVIQ